MLCASWPSRPRHWLSLHLLLAFLPFPIDLALAYFTCCSRKHSVGCALSFLGIYTRKMCPHSGSEGHCGHSNPHKVLDFWGSMKILKQCRVYTQVDINGNLNTTSEIKKKKKKSKFIPIWKLRGSWTKLDPAAQSKALPQKNLNPRTSSLKVNVCYCGAA